MKLMETLRPKFWFAAHLHCKFAAVVPWPQVELDGDKDDCDRQTTSAESGSAHGGANGRDSRDNLQPM